MVSKSLLLPLMVGLALSAPSAYAKTPKALKAENLTSKSLSFVENKGQIVNQNQEPRPDIDFRLSTGKGLNVFIGDGAIHYQWAMVRQAHHNILREPQDGILREPQDGTFREPQDGTVRESQGDNLRSRIGGTGEAQDVMSIEMYRMDVELIGANPNAEMIVEGRQNYYERYFQSWVNQNNNNQGVVAHSYRKITYKNVYPTIDWVLYVKGNTVEYDFVVRPGGKVSDIKMKYRGATELNINTDGSLSAKTPMGEITEQAPYSFQQDGQVVASRFVLNGNTLSFETDSHTGGALTIDPTLEWATYFGGLGNDKPSGIVTGEDGNIYLSGGTNSTDNIATTGSFQTVYGGAVGAFIMGDAFLAKLDPSGNFLWATYYGGTGTDRGLDVVWDGYTQHVYLAGSTKSTSGIATSGAQQEIAGGNYDAFLVQFDTAGQRIWGTYYGGSNGEGSTYAIGTCCDRNGNIFLMGETKSDNNISTPGAYQTIRGGNTDVFAVKFDSTGLRQWATYLGGEGDDYGFKASSDSLGNVFIVGNSTSTSGFSTAGSQQAVNGGGTDGFIIKLDSTGSMQWATYAGGSGYDYINSVETDTAGNCYVSGTTASLTGIATTGSFQSTYGGGPTDGFLSKYAGAGQLLWSTYYGGADIDEVQSILVNSDNTIMVAGYSISPTGIATAGSYMDTLYNATSESFISKFNNSGQQLWGTYFGGSGYETSGLLTLANDYELYLTGLTNSAVGISTAGSYQPDFGGGDGDAFLAKFNICETPQQPGTIAGDTILCSGRAYVFGIDPVIGVVSYNWVLPNGWSGSSDSSSIRIIADAGSGSISVATINNCATSDSVTLNVTVNASPEPEIENNNNVLSTTLPYSSYQWNLDGQAINGATAATYTATTDGSYSVTVTNQNGCSGTSDTIELDGVGIRDLQELREAISIYPNPTEDMVFAQSPVTVDIKVLSIEGRILWNVKKAKAISLKEAAAGMYLLHVYDQEGRLVKVEKVVKR